jgi:hypothetical protein
VHRSFENVVCSKLTYTHMYLCDGQMTWTMFVKPRCIVHDLDEDHISPDQVAWAVSSLCEASSMHHIPHDIVTSPLSTSSLVFVFIKRELCVAESSSVCCFCTPESTWLDGASCPLTTRDHHLLGSDWRYKPLTRLQHSKLLE